MKLLIVTFKEVVIGNKLSKSKNKNGLKHSIVLFKLKLLFLIFKIDNILVISIKNIIFRTMILKYKNIILLFNFEIYFI